MNNIIDNLHRNWKNW